MLSHVVISLGFLVTATNGVFLVACVNTNASCEKWAQSGECEKNPSYMISNCRQACNKCDDGTCKNFYDDVQCQKWAQKQECVANPDWMSKHCAKACGRGLCQGIQPDVETVTPSVERKQTVAPTTRTMACVNTNPSCEKWAQSGECEKNPSYMISNCRQACNKCDDGTCKNFYDDVQCQKWAQKQECVANPDWMSKHCAKACGRGLCQVACVNTNPSCEKWAQSGECEKNPSYMISNCRQACNKCDDGTCKNFYDDVQCQKWAQKQECVANPDWMSKHCTKACGRGLCQGIQPDVETVTPSVERKQTVAPTTRTSVDTCSTGRLCEHICTIISTGRKCSCRSGYVINDEDPTLCDEVQVCETKADVILVFDASSSIGAEHFDKQFVFAKRLTSNFKLGSNDVRFGGIVYSRFAEKLFDLKDYNTIEPLHKALSNVAYMDSSTYTHEPFLLIDKQKLFSTGNGGRADAPDIVVLFTDGNPTFENKALESAQTLKDSGILILGVAIGSDLDLSVLKRITSTPEDALETTSYDTLDYIEKRLTALLCKISQSPRRNV